MTEKQLVSALKRVAERMGAYTEWISQRGGKGSGTTTGAPDAFLYCSGRCIPIEAKTQTGRLSAAQLDCLCQREMQNVTTYVIRSEGEMVDLINAVRRTDTTPRRRVLLKGRRPVLSP